MKIGMIVAVADEVAAMLKKIGTPVSEENFPGYTVRMYLVNGHELYVTKSGAGEISAAAATQMLISVYQVSLIVNFGVVGGLVPEMSLTSTAVVEKAVHYDFDTSAIDGYEIGRYSEYPDVYIPASEELVKMALEIEPSLKKVVCASADKFVASAEAKTALNEQFGAHICDMETAGILLTANRNGIPALLIKAVSDSVDGGAEEFAKMISNAAYVCISVMMKILAKL